MIFLSQGELSRLVLFSSDLHHAQLPPNVSLFLHGSSAEGSRCDASWDFWTARPPLGPSSSSLQRLFPNCPRASFAHTAFVTVSPSNLVQGHVAFSTSQCASSSLVTSTLFHLPHRHSLNQPLLVFQHLGTLESLVGVLRSEGSGPEEHTSFLQREAALCEQGTPSPVLRRQFSL